MCRRRYSLFLEGVEPSITETIKTFNDINLPITHIKTDSFLPVFKVLSKLSKHLPVHIIRQLKDRLYNIVKTDQPTNKILVRDGDFDKIDDLEVVFGIGVVNELSTKGRRVNSTGTLISRKILSISLK